MTLEEIWDNITILSDYTKINSVLFGGCFEIFLTVALVVSTIQAYRLGYISKLLQIIVRIIVIIGNIGITVLCFWFYICQPNFIKLQISANAETVSSEQLAEYFEMSDISIENGQIICDIKPKSDCYNEVSYLFLEKFKLDLV